MSRFMKVAVTAFAVMFASIRPSAAEAVDVSTVTCKELVDVAQSAADSSSKVSTNKDSSGDVAAAKMGVMMIWMYGYNAANDQGTIVDYPAIDTYVGKLAEYCAKNPKVGLITASEKFSGDNAPEHSKEAVDISTTKCSAVKEVDEKTAIALMWLAGWHAASENEPMFDFEQFGQKLEKFGEYCAKNPNKGFNTAAKAVFNN
jgi:HdeA/HdeB family